MKTDRGKAFEHANELRYGSLCVMVDNKCNARCQYCLPKQKTAKALCWCCIKKGTCELCSADRIADTEFIEKLWRFLMNTFNAEYKISITGGEPTISTRIWHTIDEINKYPYRQKVLLTNGVGLNREREGITLFDYLIGSGWEIVLHHDHWDTEINNALMGYKGLTDSEIERLVQKSKGRLAINCVLQVKGIASAFQVLDYIEYAKAHWGKVPIEFSEIQFDSKGALEKDKKKYSQLKVRAMDIRQGLLAMGYKEDFVIEDEAILFSVFNQLNCSLLFIDIDKQNGQADDKSHCLMLYPDGEAGWYA